MTKLLVSLSLNVLCVAVVTNYATSGSRLSEAQKRNNNDFYSSFRVKQSGKRQQPGQQKRQDQDKFPCGTVDDGLPKSRIHNGEVAQLGAFPWHVRINPKNESLAPRLGFFCGGTIINKYWILTAAHCVPDFISAETVIVGDHDTTKVEPSEKVYDVSSVYQYPYYNHDNKFNDIALVRVANPIEWTKFVRPICMPDKSFFVQPKHKVTIAGFGAQDGFVDPNDDDQRTIIYKTQNVLKHARIPIVNSAACEEEFQGYYEVEKDGCLGELDGIGESLHGACKGDSGGGVLSYNDNSRQWTLYGVMKIAEETCKAGYTYFSRVTPFLEWINFVLNSKGTNCDPSWNRLPWVPSYNKTI